MTHAVLCLFHDCMSVNFYKLILLQEHRGLLNIKYPIEVVFVLQYNIVYMYNIHNKHICIHVYIHVYIYMYIAFM